MAPKAKPAAKAAAAPAPKAKAAAKPEAKAKKEKKDEPRPEDLIPKVPEPDAAAFDARTEAVQAEIDKLEKKKQELGNKINERSGGRTSI